MELEFVGSVWEWRGPAPFYFVTVPDDECVELEAASAFVSYGWGMIPATVHLGGTTWATALWPKDGAYVVPLKAHVRRAERVDVDDVVTIRLSLAV